jgi:preprotein translocase subunit SecG
MGNILIAFQLTTLAALINSNNFLVLFLALVVVFFLIGLLLGLTINSRKRNTQEKQQTPATEDSTESPEPTNTLEQGKGKKIKDPDTQLRQNNRLNENDSLDPDYGLNQNNNFNQNNNSNQYNGYNQNNKTNQYNGYNQNGNLKQNPPSYQDRYQDNYW